MRRIPILLASTMLMLVVPATAHATHSLQVSTNQTAILASPTTVLVSGTLTCIGKAESGTVGVVIIQPPGGVTLNGGGSAHFSCAAEEAVPWTVVVRSNEFSEFTTGKARFDTFANTSCSDEEVDCPSVGIDGILRIKASSSALSIDPKQLRFRTQTFGSFTKRSITITNTGPATLSVTIETLDVPDDFSPGQPESTCFLEGVGVNELTSGESCTEVVAFQPDPFFAQPESAELLVTARDADGVVVTSRVVKITGKGIPAK